MSCTCEIDFDYGDCGPEAFSETDRKARKEHICGECGRTIHPGETYHYESGIWEGEPKSHKTCADCLSLCDAFFCSYIYERLWEDFEQMVMDNDGNIADSRLAKLTPAAREKACTIIEGAWFENAYESMTDRQEAILRHALGLDKSEKPFRNHYLAPHDSTNYADCCALVDLGFMGRGLYDGFFHVTEDGYKAAGVEAENE